MTEELEMMYEEAKDGMEKSLEHFKNELIKIRAGKASASMLGGIMVEAYGIMSPLNQVSNVSVPDARTLSIQPFDKSVIGNIEKAILQSNIGLNPQNDGEFIRLNVPPLTEERRKDLVKQAKAVSENAKVSLRSVRKEAMDYIKGLKTDGLSEDMAKDAEKNIQDQVNDYSKKTDEIFAQKEADIMTV